MGKESERGRKGKEGNRKGRKGMAPPPPPAEINFWLRPWSRRTLCVKLQVPDDVIGVRATICHRQLVPSTLEMTETRHLYRRRGDYTALTGDNRRPHTLLAHTRSKWSVPITRGRPTHGTEYQQILLTVYGTYYQIIAPTAHCNTIQTENTSKCTAIVLVEQHEVHNDLRLRSSDKLLTTKSTDLKLSRRYHSCVI